MHLREKIPQIQEKLKEEKLDGWLLYDNHGSNRFVKEVLGIPSSFLISRRFFYWIPAKGETEIILHKIEEESLKLPGKKRLYISWIELQEALKATLQKAKKIAMEYSPKNANPYVSMVDAGTIELIKEMGFTVSSSQNLIQYFTAILNEEQIASHKQASTVLQKVAHTTFDFIKTKLKGNDSITEWDVQVFMLSEFSKEKCLSEEGPICSINAHSALPHYMASPESAATLKKDDFILLDLWCKKEGEGAIYADITRVGVASEKPTPRQLEIFEIVKEAQKKTVEFIQRSFEQKKELEGYQVDDVCRGIIQNKGFGKFFTHRTGHNIGTKVHGAGANFDNLETHDTRKILPGMCFSVEPGIYLPDEFGVRLESDILIENDLSVYITDKLQEKIICFS